jgi:hypothetical protein
MTRIFVLAGLLAAASALACNEKEPPARATRPDAAPQSAERWKEVDTPVKVGVKVPCATLLPTDPLAVAMNQRLVVEDQSARSPEATAMCRVVVAPKEAAGAKKAPDGGATASLSDADELCLVEIYCGTLFTVADMKRRCEAAGERTSQDVGDLTCIRTVAAADHTRYNVSFLDPDTRCKAVVKAGAQKFDLPPVMECARAVEKTLVRESLPPKK